MIYNINNYPNLRKNVREERIRKNRDLREDGTVKFSYQNKDENQDSIEGIEKRFYSDYGLAVGSIEPSKNAKKSRENESNDELYGYVDDKYLD